MGVDLIPEVEREKSYQPKRWSSQHRQVVALKMATNWPGPKIADVLGITAARVSVILNDPRARLEMETLGSKIADRLLDVHTKLKIYAHEALTEVVDELRNSEDEKIRQRAAFGLLDRAGYTPVQRHLVGGSEIPREVADRVAETHGELREISGRNRYGAPPPPIEDAEVVEDEPGDAD